jgi:formate dehydrogenase subunit gamma
VRFVLAERFAHWTYAFCFLAAGIRGALMWIPATRQWLGAARFTVINYHGYVGLAMVIVPLLIFLIFDRRRLGETRRALDEWDANDRRWLWAALTGRMLRGGKMPPQGRFNAGQKVNSHLVAGLAFGFVITGSLLLFRMDLPFWLVSGLLFCHKVLAVTGGVLLVGHLGIALLTKHGRGGLRAMVKGTLPIKIAREGHAIWYAQWVRQKRAEEERRLAADA